jgi:hypothetical protein
MWATFVFLVKLTKESNRSKGGNSPNLVTLIPGYFSY